MDEEEHSKFLSGRTSSEATLLGKEQHNDISTKTKDRQSFWRQYILPFCAHFVIFLSYSTVVLLLLSSRSKNAQQNCSILYCLSTPCISASNPTMILIYWHFIAPANEALHWKMQEFHIGDGTKSPYSGYPRPELEEAWGNLLGSKPFPKCRL